jgi:ABC-2 type transport system ATP-binding protein
LAEPSASRIVLPVNDMNTSSSDGRATLTERFGLAAGMSEGVVTFAVAAGEAFVPRLFAELGVPIRSVNVARPSLDDVFMSFTGSTIRDAEGSAKDWMRLAIRGRN